MARRRCSQNSGYGRMGGKGHGVETTTTESQAGGNRLMIRNTSHTSVKAATIPLLPARRSFLMVTGDLYFRTLHFGCLSLSIHPTNPALPSINHPRPPISRTPLSQHAHPSLFPAVFLALTVVFWNPFFYYVGILHHPLKIHPPHLSSLGHSPTFFSLLPLTFHAPRVDCVFSAAC